MKDAPLQLWIFGPLAASQPSPTPADILWCILVLQHHCQQLRYPLRFVKLHSVFIHTHNNIYSMVPTGLDSETDVSLDPSHYLSHLPAINANLIVSVTGLGSRNLTFRTDSTVEITNTVCAMSSNDNRSDEHAVHFASQTRDIEANTPAGATTSDSTAQSNPMSPQQLQMNQITEALGESRLQSRRASAYHFEPISLPASRVSETQTPSPANSVHSPATRSDSHVKFTASQLLCSCL